MDYTCVASIFLGVSGPTTGFPNFAECQLHSAKDRLHSAKYLPSVTLDKRHSARQSLLCRVSEYGHSAKVMPSALILGKEATWLHPGPAVCRVSNGRHSAKFQTLPSVRLGHSAKSPRQGTSTCLVCRVSRQWHSANVQIFAEC